MPEGAARRDHGRPSNVAAARRVVIRAAASAVHDPVAPMLAKLADDIPTGVISIGPSQTAPP